MSKETFLRTQISSWQDLDCVMSECAPNILNNKII